MKKIIPLIFSVFYIISSNAQAVGGWGTCEFATVATMNAFDPSTNAYDCKKVFVQATNEHYYWNGTIWVLAQGTDDQNASEVPFTPVGTIVATDVQAAIAEIEPDIYGSIDVHSDIDITTTAPSNGDLLSWDGSNFVPTSTDNGYTVFNIFAEESAALGAGQTEWAFGNGDNTPNGHGIVIPVDCELFAMSIDHEGGVNTTVRIIKNTDATLSTYQVSTTASESGYATFGTPLSFSAGDIANFTTISASSTGTSGRASAWFRIRATPASTSLVNDMLDVSAGSIASGDILYFDGSSFVPLTLEAGNIPYDNTTSGLTATDAQAAIDELASGGTTVNIYTDDGTLEEDRTVTMDGNNLTFDGTGSGDVIIEAGGDVGIGTLTPNARFDVDGGQVRFSDYGTPATYDDASPLKLLGVQADGDIVQITTANIVGTDDQVASEVPFTPVGTIASTNVQAAIAEIEPDIYGSIDVHDDVDVTTTAPSNGDVLTWDGSNFVPSSGGSSDNIYNTDGTLDANREVSLGNFDLEFNSTGTGDFFVSDNGTIAFAVEDDHVGIGIASPTNPLHIYESTGTPASATNGTIFLEKGDSGGSQSIVFESNVNAGSDYAYIEYSDDGSGNGSTTENSLLVIGVANDIANTYQDDIAIMPSGYLGVGTTSPDAFLDVEGGQVRFSDYGTGTYDDASPVKILGVQADGDIVEVDPSAAGLGNHAVGSIYISSSSTSSLTEDTPAKISGTTILINDENVDMPTSNRLRYTGSETKTFLVTCTFTVYNESDNELIYYSIYKSGNPVASLQFANEAHHNNESDELQTHTITGTVELETNDYVELWAENIDDDSDLDVEHMNLTIVSIESGGSSSGSSDNIYSADGALGEDRVVTLDGNSLTFDGTEDIVFQADGDVGIGTSTPDRKLDVEGGQVRFSDYGTGTYEDTTAVYLLGVEADGDIIEMNTAKNSRIFYPPAVAVTANSIATDLEIDLHDTYVDLFEGSDPSFIKSTSAPGAIPTYDEDELYYYILNYDTSIFANIEIDDNGLMTYDVIAVPSDNCSFINVVFVIKEP